MEVGIVKKKINEIDNKKKENGINNADKKIKNQLMEQENLAKEIMQDKTEDRARVKFCDKNVYTYIRSTGEI